MDQLCTNSEEILEILPKNRQTKITDIKINEGLLHVTLLTDCTSEVDVKSWIKEYQDNTNTTYSISTSKNCTGHYANYKKFFKCQHNTRSKKVFDKSRKNRTKNMNCPATMIIKIHAIKKRYQGRDRERGALLKLMPCEISLIVTHNHDTTNAEVLRHGRVSNDVKEKLMHLFNNGHSPTSALETIKIGIQLNYDNYPTVWANRKYCPDYMFCYHLYVKHNYGLQKFNTSGHEFLKNKIAEYNKNMTDTCATIKFHQSNYVICICPPLLKRIHQYCATASEVVLVDSASGTSDHDGCRNYILLTHGECGGLPLGIIMTSSGSSDALQVGFQLLKDMVGPTIFGGHPDGPSFLLTDDDSVARELTENAIWPRSKCLLSIFHALHTIWRCLIIAKNDIPEEQRALYFQDFRSILYAKTEEECLEKYEIAKNNITHKKYLQYFETYWQIRELWALAYRYNFMVKENNASNLLETVMRIVNNKILSRVNAFNVIQLVDFFLTKFVNYYELRLLDAANNCLKKNVFGKCVLTPPGILEKIIIVNDCSMFVPNEASSNLLYIVNIDSLMCTCVSGDIGNLCKHIDWACILVSSEKTNKIIANNSKSRETFYYIATGCDPPKVWLLPLFDGSCMHDTSNTDTSNSIVISNTISVIDESEDKTRERGKLLLQKISTAVEGKEEVEYLLVQQPTVSRRTSVAIKQKKSKVEERLHKC